jgi:predicted transcriptional regulator
MMKPSPSHTDVMSMTTPSLNRMVLQALAHGQSKPFLTAREIKTLLKDLFDADYQIQTVIVVLNRFCAKGTVKRCTFAGPEVRERYGYYIPIDSDSFRENKLKERLTAIADELFTGDLRLALKALNQLNLN